MRLYWQSARLARRRNAHDLYRDFDAVSQIAQSPYILTVHPALPLQSVKDLIGHAKANPAKMDYASTGAASLAHRAGELFALSTGTQLVHVPYKGVGAAMTDMLSGRIQMRFLSRGSRSARLRPSAARRRSSARTCAPSATSGRRSPKRRTYEANRRRPLDP